MNGDLARAVDRQQGDLTAGARRVGELQQIAARRRRPVGELLIAPGAVTVDEEARARLGLRPLEPVDSRLVVTDGTGTGPGKAMVSTTAATAASATGVPTSQPSAPPGLARR